MIKESEQPCAIRTPEAAKARASRRRRRALWLRWSGKVHSVDWLPLLAKAAVVLAFCALWARACTEAIPCY
jgi:hypothetical protein